VAVIETDKVNVDIRSTHAGQIKKYFANEGDTVSVDADFFELDTDAKGGEGKKEAAPSKKVTIKDIKYYNRMSNQAKKRLRKRSPRRNNPSRKNPRRKSPKRRHPSRMPLNPPLLSRPPPLSQREARLRLQSAVRGLKPACPCLGCAPESLKDSRRPRILTPCSPPSTK
jgi:pyruvate/2-oxoglutarate dehydrogenase complex dihydrolipoamide acyltransferase (E2) component